MNAVQIILDVIIAAFFAASLIPLIREQTWWLRAWTYARLQIFWIMFGLLVAYLVLFGLGAPREWAATFLMVVTLGICLWDILPFTPLMPVQVRMSPPDEPGHPVSLIAANVLMDNDAAQGLTTMIDNRDPDIVFLVETNQDWADRLSGLMDRYEHSYLLPLEDYNGMLLYSRYPIRNPQIRYLVQDHIPSITADLEIAPGRTVRFYGLHPRPPRPEDNTADLDNELLFIANETAHCVEPVIVTGDLNDVGWSSTTRKFLRISGLKDPRKGRGLFNSYNAKNPIVRWPLDHFFHSSHFALRTMSRGPAFGSDHFPIYIELNLLGHEYDRAETA